MCYKTRSIGITDEKIWLLSFWSWKTVLKNKYIILSTQRMKNLEELERNEIYSNCL